MQSTNTGPARPDMIAGAQTFQRSSSRLIFATTKQTLTSISDSVLSVMFGDDLQMRSAEKDGTGAFVIDRDPEAFKVILAYLRNGK